MNCIWTCVLVDSKGINWTLIYNESSNKLELELKFDERLTKERKDFFIKEFNYWMNTHNCIWYKGYGGMRELICLDCEPKVKNHGTITKFQDFIMNFNLKEDDVSLKDMENIIKVIVYNFYEDIDSPLPM